MKKPTFYITTTLPYVNAEPHIGFAMEIIRADSIARFKRLQGYDVFFNTGTDEHGTKIFQSAKEDGFSLKEYTDKLSEKFRGLQSLLNLSCDSFIRTTDDKHLEAAEAFWKLVKKNGFIEKRKYKGLYCVGCELFLTEKDLVNGKCPIHPNRLPEILEEENYFFLASKFNNDLKKYFEKNNNFVMPAPRFNEAKAFLERGISDFSISRIKEKMPWGVPVPGDPTQVMYVWFDALVSYISALGWPEDLVKFNKFWVEGETVQYCGKDNLRQQSLMWQSMLLSAGLPLTKQIVVNGFIQSGGQKMSKSLGNVISPTDLVKEYGTDAVRYFLLREVHPFEDSDVTLNRFKNAYNGSLANGLGNLVSRVMKMSEKYVTEENFFGKEIFAEVEKAVGEFNMMEAMDFIWRKISEVDLEIQKTQPFVLVKEDREKGQEVIQNLVGRVGEIAVNLTPFMPETSDRILELIKENKSPNESIFPRKE